MQNLKSFKKDIPQEWTRCSRVSCPASRSGYLLIELLVAITIFSVIVTVVADSFVNVLRTQRQVAALSAAQSNLGVVMEQMAREIRTGSFFCISADGTTTDTRCGCSVFGNEEVCSALTFTDAETEENIEYFVNASGIFVKSIDGAMQEITGSDVKIQYANFILFGNTPGDQWNPRITITVGIRPNDASLSGDVLNLETTVSARQIDCPPGGLLPC